MKVSSFRKLTWRLSGRLHGSRPQSIQKPESWTQELSKFMMCMQVQSKLIFVVEWSLTPSVIVLFMVYFVIYMCTLLVVDYFVNLKRC